ncbi:hypothetical protein ACOSQ2_003031 [Xanthoceras sorbifolium]
MADKGLEKPIPAPPGRSVVTPPVSLSPATPHSLSPSPGTYIVIVPKNQIYRVPPPENARLYQQLSRTKSSRKLRCCCCCFLLVFLLVLASAAAVSFFVFRPKHPKYTVNDVSFKSLNLTTIMFLPSIYSIKSNIAPATPSPPLVSSDIDAATPFPSPVWPEFNDTITLTAINPNNKFGIHYYKGGSVQVFYNHTNLFDGVLPQFYQPVKNLTAFKTVLHGEIKTSSLHDQLADDGKTGTMTFTVIVRAPVKFKLGSIQSTWTTNVKVMCDVTVLKLTAESKIISQNCQCGVHHWWVFGC